MDADDVSDFGVDVGVDDDRDMLRRQWLEYNGGKACVYDI
jgi:hypothetical protein